MSLAEAIKRIVLCYPVEKRHHHQIEQKLADLGVPAEVVDAGQERIAEELPNADIYCGHAKVPVPWDDVVRGGRLKWIQSSAAGMDHCLVPEVIDSGIAVSSASGVLANQVADHTFALLTGLLRDLPTFFRAQQKREFIRLPTRDLHGAKIGIVGFGGNGRRLFEVLKPFKCRIWATDLFPQNADTEGMIDARRLALLPKNALVVNMARGRLVVERDLVAAIQSGHLGGAGLDVTEIEPLPPESGLWELPNVIITPHVGGQAASRIDDMTDFFCENLERYVQGRPLLNYLAEKSLGFPHPEHAAWAS